MSQARTVARLATRELWMTFRLLLVLISFVGAGVVVGVVPALLTEAMARLAIGMGIAIAVAAAVAAWSIGEERSSGRVGWLVTRSVARSTYLGGWYVALVLIGIMGLVGGGVLGWLAIPARSSAIDAVEYVVVMVAIGATLGAAIAGGLLAGALLRPRGATVVTLVLCAAAAAAVVLLPAVATWLPGGALPLLVRAAESEPVLDDALRAAGVGLALAAALLVACRVAFELTDL